MLTYRSHNDNMQKLVLASISVVCATYLYSSSAAVMTSHHHGNRQVRSTCLCVNVLQVRARACQWPHHDVTLRWSYSIFYVN